MTAPDPVALVHDYLTQRGGAERVVLSLTGAYPAAPLHTSLYDPEGTFPDFARLDIRTLPVDRVGVLRSHHRLALPLLAPAFSRLTVDAEVTICSSSGWAHGARVTGRKVVYCHTPARWLYQTERYLEGSSRWSSAALSVLAPALRRWDRRAAATADRYLVNSTAVRQRVADLYGIDAEVVPPPVEVDPDGADAEVAGLEPGFLLCVSRLLAYKNVEAVTAAFGLLPSQRLVVVGSGPLAASIRAAAPPNVTLLGPVEDAELRWLYRSCAGLVAASHEDFGLTPVEAAGFGKAHGRPAVGRVSRHHGGGDHRGVLRPAGTAAHRTRRRASCRGRAWNAEELRAHAGRYSVDRFVRRVDEVVTEERGGR